jgi:hypothetical protein
MTEKRPTPDESAGKGRRKSAAPTIDLKATEVRAEPAAGDPPGKTPPVQETPANVPPAHEPPKKDPPVKEPPKPKPPAQSQGSAAPPPPPGDRKGGGSVSAFVAGIAGALAISLILAGLWFAGILTPRDGGSNAQIAALEKKIQDLQNRPAPEPANTDALRARIAKMEDTLKNMPAGDNGLAERASAADNAMKSLGLALTALNRRNEEIAEKASTAQQRADAAEKAVSDLRASAQDVSKTANAGPSSAELEPLEKRIAALEQQIKGAQTQIEKALASDKSVRLALSATALREAVTRGAPFGDELAQAKSLGGERYILSPLTPFATSGLPDEKQLAAELRALSPALQKAAGSPKPSGNFIERLQANAEHLVRIRPVDAPPGDDPSAVLARIEVDAAHDDINATLADLSKLPEKTRAPAQSWIEKAKSRQAALAAARGFAADAARALGPK